jgi:hypothetical protein
LICFQQLENFLRPGDRVSDFQKLLPIRTGHSNA